MAAWQEGAMTKNEEHEGGYTFINTSQPDFENIAPQFRSTNTRHGRRRASIPPEGKERLFGDGRHTEV